MQKISITKIEEKNSLSKSSEKFLEEKFTEEKDVNSTTFNKYTPILDQELFDPNSLLQNYNKNENFIVKSADKCFLYDIYNNKYLDMYAGICVKNLGENYQNFSETIYKTALEGIQVSNYFYNKNEIKLASLLRELVKESIPNAKVFFCNSGTEADEAALKFAILQNANLKNEGKILSFKNAFHGRTLGSLGCTYNKSYREPFKNYMSDQVVFWDFNKCEGLEKFIEDNKIRILISEPIQGEGGIIPMSHEFAETIKKIHSQKKFLWISDEIQVSLGRVGELFAHNIYGIKPDFVTLAKALGNGVPIGAVICNENCIVLPGQHGTTFGGNPLATGISYWVLNKILKENLTQRAKELGIYLKTQLKEIKDILEKEDIENEMQIKEENEKEGKNLKKIIDIRGEGLLIGVQLDEKYPVSEMIQKLFEEKVLCIAAGNNTLRIAPPLIISKEEINIFLNAFKKILGIKFNKKSNIIKNNNTTKSNINGKPSQKESTYVNSMNNLNNFQLENKEKIEKNTNKTMVWKISGDIDEKNFIHLLLKFNKFTDKGYKIAVVFGAGTAINEELKNQNIKIEYINGQRKTSLEIIEILKKVIEKQKLKLLNIANKILPKGKQMIAVESPIFSAKKDKMETHGYVLEPESAEVSKIESIWGNQSKSNKEYLQTSIALVSFLAEKDEQVYNANADICAARLAIELKADLIGFSVGHEIDISKIEEKNISLSEIENRFNKKALNFTEGFRMKLTEIKKVFDSVSKSDMKCYIGNICSEIPETFNAIPKSGIWIRKRDKYNVGIIGSRGLIGTEIIKYIKKNSNFNLFKFSLLHPENKNEPNSNNANNKFIKNNKPNSDDGSKNELNYSSNISHEEYYKNNCSNENQSNGNGNGNGVTDVDAKKFDFNYLKIPNQLDSPLNKQKASALIKELNINENHITKLKSFAELNDRSDIDIWISACPNNILKNSIHLINPEIPIIDVSSDFRHVDGWEYAMCYTNGDLTSNRISNPGCYSSAVISALYPLSKIKEKIKNLKNRFINKYTISEYFEDEENKNLQKEKKEVSEEKEIKNIFDLMEELESCEFESNITGVSSHSGAGKDYLLKFPSLHETIIPYQPLCHSQQEEMRKFLGFDIHFVPMVTDQFHRGIICTLQIKCTNDQNFEFDMEKLKQLYEFYYSKNEFINCVWDTNNVITTNSISDTTNIILSNFSLSANKKILHIQSTIDNLSIGGGFSTYLNLCKFFGISYNQNSYYKSIHNVPISSFEAYEIYLNSLEFPLGFKAATTNIPFKSQEIDRKKVLQFTCIRIDIPAKWTAVYTLNPICGHPITIGRKRMELKKPIRAIWINNKIANVGSSEGLEDAEEICNALSQELDCQKDEVIPLSTGIIGWKLPKKEIISNLSHVTKGEVSVAEVARAIMTTDSYPKAYVEKLSNGAEILGIAKGAGMIEPNMGTVIVLIMTDAQLEEEFLEYALKECTNESFNCISIDSDTSTSDAALLVSTGLKNHIDKNEFMQALMKTCKYLARQIVWNGEGVQHVIEVKVKNCPNKKLAKLIGKNIVNSPLTKAAICGNDPNVGRIIGSMARQVDNIDWSLVNVKIGDKLIFIKGNVIEWNAKIEAELTEYLKKCQIYSTDVKPAYPVHDNSVIIEVDMNQGDCEATIIGGDLTIDYVKINGNYRS